MFEHSCIVTNHVGGQDIETTQKKLQALMFIHASWTFFHLH